MSAILSSRIFCVLLAIVLAGCEHGATSIDQIIEKNTNAMGGRAAMEAINSIQINLHIVDPTFEVDGVYRAMRPGWMRIDITAGGKHVYTEALNGERAWQWKGEGDPISENAQATAALRHGVELPGKLFGLHEMRQRGHQIILTAREQIDGINYHVLRITLADGYTTSAYVDPKTWFIKRRRDVRPLHPDVDPRPTTIEYQSTDFRKIGGVYFGFSNTDTELATGKILERTTITGITLNPNFDAAIFDRL
jgi:hypothetical protein